MRKSSACRTFLRRAAVAFLLVPALCDPLPAVMTDRVPPNESFRALPETTTARHYFWEDVNSPEILRVEGDREIVDASRPALRFTLEVFIDPIRLRRAVESYGVPESWLTYRYRTEDEKRQRERDMIARCAPHGVARGRKADSLEPDYCWVVQVSRDDVREAAARLKEVGRRAGYNDFPRFVGLLASFVQSLEYRLPPDVRRGRDGVPIQTFGLTMPIETLYNGHGDCDTKSALFASLLLGLAETRLILVRGENHLFAGVRMQPRPYERFIRLRGEDYVLVELTHPWRLGHIPNENWHAVRLKQMEVLPLFR